MNRLLKNKLTQNGAKEQKKFIKEIRHNIKELNRSMESIEKMIERSRDLLKPYHPVDSESIEKSKLKITNHASFNNERHTYNPLFEIGKNDKREDKVCEFITENKSNMDNKSNIMHHDSSVLQNRSAKSVLNQQFQLKDEKQHQPLFHFSPQKTKRSRSASTNTKNPSIFNPENTNKIIIKPTHQRFLSFDNQKSNLNNTSTKSCKIKFNSSSKKIDFSNKVKKDQCKTEYKDENDKAIDKLNGNSKKCISIKLFSKQAQKNRQREQLKSIIIDKSFKVQPPYIIKLKQILKNQNENTNSAEVNENMKTKFIQRISQYKFVQNYLNKNQIWSIYDRIVSENIPELKWPIIIVDEVYKKIQNPQ